jgi:hypothetical protein
MAILIGKKISEELSIYIRKYANNFEYKDVVIKHDLSDELARKLVSRERKITKKNLPMFLDILKLAIKNRNLVHERLLKGHTEAEKITDCKIIA